jgi:hypothetical protein
MSPASSPHPAAPQFVQVRVARPTDRLAAIIDFYGNALGLPELFRFTGHAGYDGVMFGLPGAGHHLEFTARPGAGPYPAPTPENLLVLYFADEGEQQEVAARLATFGHRPVPAENPYWTDHGGITVEDPDGWRVVLMPAPVFGA